jgi:fumarylpyruvate hydrolase
MPYPPMTNNLHHEVELVVAIGVGGKNITIADAQKHVWGYALGLDMTRRDLQAESKKAGRPWSTGKGFDFAAPIAPIHPISETGWIDRGAIHLSVNDTLRQKSDVSNLIWNVAEVIATLSTYFTLQPGDLIYTGTPEGVGAVKQGDMIKAGIDQLGELQVKIV